jgi:hypothetical protein
MGRRDQPGDEVAAPAGARHPCVLQEYLSLGRSWFLRNWGLLDQGGVTATWEPQCGHGWTARGGKLLTQFPQQDNDGIGLPHVRSPP